jgi:D-citramalate synthase
MDTTLRDGEQTPNVAYAPSEKLQIARLLLEQVRVDRLEIGQVFVSEGEAEAVRRITAWARRAGHSERIEIFGLCDG